MVMHADQHTNRPTERQSCFTAVTFTTLVTVCLPVQGQQELQQQQRQIDAAIARAYPVQLGNRQQWGECLAVQVDAQVSGIRSALGNALAEESQRRGLRAMAAVAYVEVRSGLPPV